MKKLIALSVFAAFITQGCYTINYGGKKPFFLVDAPPGTTVANNKNKEKLEVGEYTAFKSSTTSGNVKTTINYNYPGFLLKVKKRNEILLQSGSKKPVVMVDGRAGVGMLIFEGIFTLGIGTIVDLATGSFYYSKNRYIDVAAYMEGKKPRTQKELKRYVQSQFNNGTRVNDPKNSSR